MLSPIQGKGGVHDEQTKEKWRRVAWVILIYLNLPQGAHYKTTSEVHNFEPIVNYLYLAVVNYGSGRQFSFNENV